MAADHAPAAHQAAAAAADHADHRDPAHPVAAPAAGHQGRDAARLDRDADHPGRDADHPDPDAGHPVAAPAADHQEQVDAQPSPAQDHSPPAAGHPAPAEDPAPPDAEKGPGQAVNFAACDPPAGHRRKKTHEANSLTGSPKLVSVWAAGTSGPTTVPHVTRRTDDQAIHSAAVRRFTLAPERRGDGAPPRT